jgi:hypothetical protein
MQSATKISLVTLVVAVAALVLALLPVVADAPWENGLTEEQIYETIKSETDAKADADANEEEAKRLAKCDSILRLLNVADGNDLPWSMIELLTELVIENGC